MPRYFFHIDDGALIPDRQGTELADIREARSQAVTAAGELLAEVDGRFWGHEGSWQMQVTDEVDRLLFTLRFSADIPSGEVIFRPAEQTEHEPER